MIHPRNIVPGYSHKESFSLFSLGTLVDEGVRQFVETGSSEVKRIHPEKIFTQTKYSSIRNIHPNKIFIQTRSDTFPSRFSTSLQATALSSTQSLPRPSSRVSATLPPTSSSTATTAWFVDDNEDVGDLGLLRYLWSQRLSHLRTGSSVLTVSTYVKRVASYSPSIQRLQAEFVWIANCICRNCKLYLSGFPTVSICLKWKLYLFELQIVFVWIANCICQVFPLYLFELQIVFV